MSNPGVITLADTRIGQNNFRIEDNIGEAIHIHYGNIRLDMSIDEFARLVNELKIIMTEMMDVDNFSFDRYDALFLSDVTEILLNLENISFEDIQVSELRAMVTDEFGCKRYMGLSESDIYKALHGDFEGLKRRRQTHYWNMDMYSRCTDIAASIREYGYEPDGCGTYIVVCDEGNIITDGDHRASALFAENPDAVIKIARWKTKYRYYDDENIIKYAEEYNDKLKRKMLLYFILNRDLSGKKILIKGAGTHTLEILKYLRTIDCEIVGVQDNKLRGGRWNDIPVISKSEILEKHIDVILISSYVYRSEMKKEMMTYAHTARLYDIYEEGIDKEFFREV
jgi:hypothetical protein